MMKTKIKKILIANRGEIALRIQSTCLSLGIETVAVHTKEDQFLSYVYKSNSAHQLKKNGYLGYLDQDLILEIAKKEDVDAIHPGYGFLSENFEFAKKVIDSGIIWIGPSPKIIEIFSDKSKSKELIKKFGIPTIPSNHFKTSSKNLEFPLIIKCAVGGGGKAMRVVKEEKLFEEELKKVMSESKNQFASDKILIEKYLEQCRHIEVQIAADGKNFIHLFERECSIQRKNQKIIEEAPCNFINKKTKEKLCEASIKIASHFEYDSIGTIEFLVDKEENFYFLEANPRLQVEHSVTELTTHIDLVALQIHIAENKTLPYKQLDISQNGHAIESRIYSENPNTNFSASSGKIINLQIPSHPFIRIDHDLEEGEEISPNFDAMISKITSFGKTRESAIKYLSSYLKRINISGIKTNINFLIQILESQEFFNGKIHTQILKEKDFLEKVLSWKNDPKETILSDKEIEKIISFSKISNKKSTTKFKPNNWKNQLWN